MQMVQSLDAEEIRQLLRQVELQYVGYEPQIIRSLGEVSYSGCD
jgi:hypothetical protein